MAMNKREQAEMESLREELRIAKALRFTEKVEPDLDPPVAGRGSFNELSKGFDFNAHCSGSSYPRVEKACSSSIGHCFGRDDNTTTQGSRRLFTTDLLAWRACRNVLEMEFAKKLAYVDKQIESLST